uniref:hypothetical protein n=1 Tax=Actinacidiphila soli TaxID=2487275 RepID=UPI001F0CDC62|nr:hypothetical protein [Actinacidiphila soli]
MYVRTSSRRNKSGQVVRYLQLAHNEWDSAAGVSRTKVLHSFGREDEIDRDAIERLVAALTRLLDPTRARRTDRTCRPRLHRGPPARRHLRPGRNLAAARPRRRDAPPADRPPT